MSACEAPWDVRSRSDPTRSHGAACTPAFLTGTAGVPSIAPPPSCHTRERLTLSEVMKDDCIFRSRLGLVKWSSCIGTLPSWKMFSWSPLVTSSSACLLIALNHWVR